MISVLYTIILITNFKLIEMCIKSSPHREGRKYRDIPTQTIIETLPLNPNLSLEPKHILFYYQADCLAF